MSARDITRRQFEAALQRHGIELDDVDERRYQRKVAQKRTTRRHILAYLLKRQHERTAAEERIVAQRSACRSVNACATTARRDAS